MSDIDEIRTALSDALRLPGEIHPRPGAATTIRARARSRRRRTVVTFAMAVPVFLGLVALLVGTNDPNARSVSPPAGQVTATPSASIPASRDSVPPGPRTLATPIEIRPVLRAYLTCPANSNTVPAAEGRGCYRVGPAAMVVRRLRNMTFDLVQKDTGSAIFITWIEMRLTSRDTTAFSALTAASLHKQVAFVVGGKVWAAPFIHGHITEGNVEISVVDRADGQALVTELTG